MPTRAASPPKAGYHHGQLRDTLIALALDAPSIEALSLRQLAAAAGVSATAVYRHFDNKDALLFEVAALGFERLAQRFEAVCPLNQPATSARQAVQRLEAMATAYLAFARDEPRLWGLMFGAAGSGYRGWFALRPSNDMTRPSSFEYLPWALAQLHAQGAVTQQPDLDDALFAWAVIHGAAALALGDIPAFQRPVSALAVLVTHRLVASLQH